MTRKTDMCYPRQAQGICAINNYVYCVCGISADEAYDHVERYDTLTDKWELLDEKYPKASFSMSCIPIKKRYIYTFGEAGYDGAYASQKTDNFYKLDTFQLSKGWESITLTNPFNFIGC